MLFNLITMNIETLKLREATMIDFNIVRNQCGSFRNYFESLKKRHFLWSVFRRDNHGTKNQGGKMRISEMHDLLISMNHL